MARFSGALWRRGFEHLDVLGIALRFRNSETPAIEPALGDQDLLFATIRSPFTMPFTPLTTIAGDYAANVYWAVCPFDSGQPRRVKFRMRPQRPAREDISEGTREQRLTNAVRAGEAIWQLDVRHTLSRRWSPLMTISLAEETALDDQALRFSPFLCGRGIIPRGFVQAMRRAVYPASQRARPDHVQHA